MKKVDHDLRRQQIASAAAQIIAYQGLEALTTRRLAAAMGCTIGVLSHYFDNKDQIVIAAMLWADTRIQARVQQALQQDLQLADLEAIVLSAFPLDAQSDLEWRVRLNLAAHALNHPVLNAQQQQMQQQWATQLLPLIARYRARLGTANNIDDQSLLQYATDMMTGTAFNLLKLPLAERPAKVSFVVQFLAAINLA